MAISRAQLVKELEPGLNALFGLEYKNYDNEHAEIFDIESSERAFEEEVMLLDLEMHKLKRKVKVYRLTMLKRLSLQGTQTKQSPLHLLLQKKLSKITCMTDLRLDIQKR